MTEALTGQTTEVEVQLGAVEDVALEVRERVAAQLLIGQGSINDILRELTGAVGKKVSFSQGTDGEVQLAVEETTPERVLAPEVQTALLAKTKARFDAYPNRHEGVNWTDVQASLEADPALLWSLNEMDANGHAPDVYKEDGEAYYFGTCSAESPETARNIVYDAEAQAWLAANYPQEVCNGNAVEMATAMEIDLMDEDQYRFLQTLGQFDANTWSYLKTPTNIRTPKNAKESGVALCGSRRGEHVRVNRINAYYRAPGGAFRGSLRVPKKLKP